MNRLSAILAIIGVSSIIGVASAEYISVTLGPVTGVSTAGVAAVTTSKTDVRGKVVAVSFSCTTNADWSLVTTDAKGASLGGSKTIMLPYTNTMAMNSNLSETVYLLKDTVTLGVSNAVSTNNSATLRMVLER